MPINITIQFLAPVAVGSEITVFFFEEVKFFGGWEETDPIILDHKNGILYEPYWMPLEATPEDFLNGSFNIAGYRLNKAKSPCKAHVLRCTVRTKGIGEMNSVNTFLVLEPIKEDKEPYRG